MRAILLSLLVLASPTWAADSPAETRTKLALAMARKQRAQEPAMIPNVTPKGDAKLVERQKEDTRQYEDSETKKTIRRGRIFRGRVTSGDCST